MTNDEAFNDLIAVCASLEKNFIWHAGHPDAGPETKHRVYNFSLKLVEMIAAKANDPQAVLERLTDHYMNNQNDLMFVLMMAVLDTRKNRKQ
jgi:hypothetical protein